MMEDMIVWLGDRIDPVSILIFFCGLVIVVAVYIKLRYPFWNIQPVLHPYNLMDRVLRPLPSIPFPRLPLRTKYVYVANGRHGNHEFKWTVKSKCADDYSPMELQEICHFLQTHTIPHDRLFSSIDVRTFRAHFRGYVQRPLITLLQEITIGSASSLYPPILGMIASRSVEIRVPNIPHSVFAFYFDFYCVHREHRTNTMNGRTLFQTHEYNQRHVALDVHVSVFRKEMELFRGIVPFVQFVTATYYMPPLLGGSTGLPMKTAILPPLFRGIRIEGDGEHSHYLVDFLANISAVVASSICIPVNAMMELVKERQMYVCALCKGQHLYALYIFRNANIKYDEMEETGDDMLSLVASFCNIQDNQVGDESKEELFYAGFLNALESIRKDRPSTTTAKKKGGIQRRHSIVENYGMFMMDEIGDNILLSQMWRKTHTPMTQSISAYYLYNYIVSDSPVTEKNVMVIL
jgi:hypothetical protein